MRMENGETLNLMALYTTTQHEREALRQQHQEERQLQTNRMLQARDTNVEEGHAKVFELRPAIRELARTLDAVTFVVDASTNLSTSKNRCILIIFQKKKKKKVMDQKHVYF